jgi:hypothetical protein
MGGTEYDPFAMFSAPPAGETPEERMAREQREQEAQRISDKIDDELKAEKAMLKKRRGVVKVLLLGQSESGTLVETFPCTDRLLTISSHQANPPH